MLVRNGQSMFQNPGRFTGALDNRSGNIIKGGFRNRMVGGLNNTFDGYANGHLAPSAFVLPTKGGSISSYVGNAITMTANTVYLIMGMPMNGSSTITITATPPQLDAIVPMTGTGAISLAVNSASLAAAVSATASGSITLTGSAQLGGIFELLASGSISMSSAVTMSALAWIEAEAGGPTPLSPEGLAAAVWGAQSASFNDPGTMGEKLNDAGSASNPWTEVIESGYTAAEIMRLLAAVAFGRSTITDLGGGNATVIFKSIDGTKDRIEAGMTGSERTTIDIDET